MTPLSAVIITRNEEKHLPEALRSLAFCEEILVVDAGSTDGTREVAERAGARVLVSTPWPGFVAQRRKAVEAARHDWILALDADERVTPALRHEIEAARTLGFTHAGYRIPRVSFYLGRWVRGTDWYPDFQLRLFDRTRGGWGGGLVHESVQVTGPVGRLRAEIEHYPYSDIADHLQRINEYTTLWARQAYAEGRRTNLIERVGAPCWAFVRNYVLKRGVLLGRVGFTVSVLNACYTFTKLAKLDDLSRSQTPPP